MMKKIFFSLLLGCTAFLLSCGGDSVDTDNPIENKKKNDQTILFAETEKFTTLDPIKIVDVVSFHVAEQIFEGLVRFDEKDLSLQPSIAKSWNVDDKKQVYTFKLRKGIYFHANDCFEDKKGRELKSSDVLYSFKRMYSNTKGNYAATAFKGKVLGGESFYNDTTTAFNEKELQGVKIIDDYTIEISLTQPYVSFLELVSTMSASIVAKEAIDKNEIVGTGPFVYDKAKDVDSQISLTKNKNYYLKDSKGVQLPYLEGVVFKYVKSSQKQMDLFLAGELDVVTGLPPTGVKDMVNNQIADFQDKPVKYVLGSYPEMATTYLSLNNLVAPFNNKKVRQAFAMAIDKNKILEEVLKGEAFGVANNGIVPPAIAHYDYSSVVGLEFNIIKAKELLKEAGYPDGKDFPPVTLTSSKSNNSVRTALNIQKQILANLNISIEIESFPLAEVIAKERKGETEITLSSWLAEFPDPISFLSLYYGADLPKNIGEVSHLNRSRCSNAAYNSLYLKTISTIDRKRKYEMCLELDQIIANDVPAIPLWYHENFRLIQGEVKNYQPNTMNIHYLANVKVKRIVITTEE